MAKSSWKKLLLAFSCIAGFGTAAEDVKLLLPEKIYAVPGVECNIYFNNIVTVINPANYVFEVKCEKGRNDLKRWRYTPNAEEVGTYPLELRVISMQGIVAKANVQLIVLPPDAGAGKEFHMLFVGASQTNAGHYPNRVAALMKRPGNPVFKTIGTRSRGKDGAKHEGYGGWRWHVFMTRYGYTGSRKMDGMHPDRPVGFNSPFIFQNEKGEYKFDLNKYFAINNNGRIPDAVSFQLGLNDFFLCTDENIVEVTAKSMKDMEKLIAEFRKLKPTPEIFIFQHIPGSNQDGFGASYGCQQSSWQYRKNLDYYNRALAKQAKKLGLHAVPVYMNFDTENNYPVITSPVNLDNPQLITRQNNGVHPSIAGYNQMADTLYCAVKAVLANQK